MSMNFLSHIFHYAQFSNLELTLLVLNSLCFYLITVYLITLTESQNNWHFVEDNQDKMKLPRGII